MPMTAACRRPSTPAARNAVWSEDALRRATLWFPTRLADDDLYLGFVTDWERATKEIRWLREARLDRLADEAERRLEERGAVDDSRFDLPDAQPSLMIPEGDGEVEVRPPSLMQLRRWLP